MTLGTFWLYDGTTAVIMTDANPLVLRNGGWGPQAPQRRAGALGGWGPYEEVVEEIALDATGTLSSMTGAINNAWVLLDQARRWADGDGSATAVRLLAYFTAGTLPYLDAAVVDGTVIFPDTFNDMLASGEIADVRLQVTRRSPWLAEVETAVNSAATNVGEIFTVTWASSHDLLSPIRLHWTAPNSGRNACRGPIIVCETASQLGIMEAETFGTAGSFATSSPAASAVARGGQILTFTTPAGLSEERALSYANIPTICKSGAKRVDIWAICAVPGTSAFQISWNYAGGTQVGVYSARVPITNMGGSTRVDGFYCGTLDIPEGGLDGLSVRLDGPSAGTALVMDYFVFVERRPTTFVMQPTVYGRTNVFGSGNTVRMVWDANQLTYPEPLIALERTSGSVRAQAPAFGDRWIGTKGPTLCGIWMACGDGVYRYPSSSGATTPLSVTYQGQRKRAYATLR